MTHNEIKEILHHENRYLAEYTTGLGDDYRIWFIGTVENIVSMLKSFTNTDFLKIVNNFDEIVCTLYDGTIDWYIDGELKQEILTVMKNNSEKIVAPFTCDFVTEEDYANYCRNER